MPFCRNCGTEYNDIDTYCVKCGKQLNDSIPSSSSIPEKNESIKVNNTLVWIIALMPLIGLLAENTIAVLSGMPMNQLWWVTVLANITLCSIDIHMIKKTIPQISFTYAWILIIPAYLYKRAKVLKQSLAYFFVWLILFALLIFVPQSWLLNNSTLNLGLGSSQTISSIKNGYFKDYKQSDVGDAFDSYMPDAKWTSFTSTNGLTIVQVTGTNSLNQEIIVQFTVNSDNSWAMSYLDISGTTQPIINYNSFISQVFGVN